MKKRDTNQILIKYYEAQDQYERMATELHRLLDEDQRFPAESVYTVKHRLKKPDRLIEKIRAANTRARKGVTPIDHSNFQSRVDDLLGVRVVCLRLADLVKLKQYLNSLGEEQKLRFIKGPTEKKTFLIRPGEGESGSVHTRPDMQYTGYSSIHYVVKLGRRLQPPKDLAKLKAELQLRTILEEAWGEIDHKYRYELTRSGRQVPSHIETGFRDLGLYLQAAARQADHLCEDVEALVVRPTAPTPRIRRRQSPTTPVAVVPIVTGPADGPVTLSGIPEAPPLPSLSTVGTVIEQIVGFAPTPRTMAYVYRRLDQHSYHTGYLFDTTQLQQVLTPQLLDRFRHIYTEILNAAPFTHSDLSRRDLDVVHLINFALFTSVQSRSAAEAGLRATLRRTPSTQEVGSAIRITVAQLANECSVQNRLVLSELKRLGLYVFSPTATIDASFADSIRMKIRAQRREGGTQ
jgi:ppGpp synthetase/RelA/SpoT-type nucleotidyltranferase